MKIILVVLLLIMSLPVVCLTHANTNSPLMMLKNLGGEETVNKPLEHNASNKNRRSESTLDQSDVFERDTSPKLCEKDSDPTDPWNLVYVPRGSETIQLARLILNNEAALKSEITNVDLLSASIEAASLRSKAQQELNEIEDTFNKEKNEIEKNFYRDLSQDRNVLTDLFQMVTSRGNTASQREQEAENKKLIALSNAKAATLTAFSLKAFSALPQRNVILESGSQGNKVQQLMQEVESCAKSIISSLQEQLDQGQNNEEKKVCVELIIMAASLAQKMQWLMLGSHTPFYITDAKNRLNKLVREIATHNDSQDLQRHLEKINSDFQCAEAESPETALEVIITITTNLQSEIQQLDRGISRDSSNIRNVSNEDAIALQKIIDDNKKNYHFLQLAMLTYKLIQNELMIETECGSLPELKESIEQDLEILKNHNTSPETLAKLSSILNDKEIVPAELLAAPQNLSHVLSWIQSLDDSHNERIIRGEHGKIILENLEENNATSEESFLTKASTHKQEKDRKKWVNGIGLIRIAIARKYGRRGAIPIFDEEFITNRKFHISLTVKDLKDFLNDKIPIPASHFLSPLQPIEKFITRLNSAAENELLKWDEAVFHFNPFLSESIPHSEQTLQEVHQQELIAGKKHAREAVEKIFKTYEIPISVNRIQNILHRFDVQFGTSSSLSAKDLRTFLDQENKKIRRSPRDLFDDYFPANVNISYNLFTGALSGIGSTTIALFALHLSPINVVFFTVGGGIAFPLGYILGSRSTTPAVEERR